MYIRTMQNALIVIDVQQGFMNKHTESLPQKIADHIRKNDYDFIVFTTFLNEIDSNFRKILDWHGNSANECLFIPDELRDIADENLIVSKSTYSIFGSPKLEEFLTQKEISHLFLCGIDLDGCVLASAFHAFDKGFNVVVLPELSRSSAGEALDKAAWIIIERNLTKKTDS